MLLAFLTCFLVLLLLTYCLKLLLNYLKLREIINRIPGPPPYFLFGNLLDIIGTPEQIFHKQRQLASEYKIYRLWISQLYHVILIHLPEDIEVVISSTNNIAKSIAYSSVKPWLKEGLLTSSGANWRSRRKMLTPSFHFSILQQFIPIFFQQANMLVTKLSHLHKKTKRGIDIVPHTIDYALQSICETTMGTNFDMDNNVRGAYSEAIEEIGKLLVYRTLHPWLLYKWVYFFTPSYYKQKEILKTLHHISGTVLQNRKEYHTQNTSKRENKKKLALLDLLLQLKENGSITDDRGIEEEVDTFIFAGHETTGLSLSFTLMLLANHKNIQEKVYEEITEVLSSSDSPPSYQDLQKLTYLELCIKEALRLYPSVPFIARETSTDLVTVSGYLIPKNTQIGISIYDLHRNPDLYPEPERFHPERFLPENCTDRHRFAFLPFSGGPRNCIGQKFAMLEMKTLISSMLNKYILEPVDTPESLVLTQDMVLRPKHGVRIRLIPRSDRL